MKSPAEVAALQGRLWARNDIRVERMLDDAAWPLVVPLTKPPAGAVARRPADVRTHLDAWRAVDVGRIDWEPVNFRATGGPIDVPVRWTLPNRRAWIAAIDDPGIAHEFETLERLLSVADPRYRNLLVRRRPLVTRTDPADVEAALRIAETVGPGWANGAPLRALALAGVDTKFYERNRVLLLALLDERFDGAASVQGLEEFLGAAGPDGHWLLVADLDGSLLPYRRTRVTDVELAERGLPGERLLVVENEKCLHALPPVSGTVAVLGTGLNVGWLASEVFDDQPIAYWGDLDTWGLRLLAAARVARPGITPLLMDESIYMAHRERAVVEPEPAPWPDDLEPAERALFDRLRRDERGRLEQEFLPPEVVHDAVATWLESLDPGPLPVGRRLPLS